MAQWNQWCLGSARRQVPSPGQHSGLGIRLGCNCGLDLIPSQGNFICHQKAEKKKKENKREMRKVFQAHVTAYAKVRGRNSLCGSALRNLTSILEAAGSTPGLDQRVKDLALPCAVV